ncbi:MAG: sugar ABC transporter substrate-binding protein [Chloroflexota bacterium]
MKRFLLVVTFALAVFLTVACQPQVVEVEKEVEVTVEVEKIVEVEKEVEVEVERIVEVEKEVEVTRVVELEVEVEPEMEAVSIAIFHPVLGNSYTKALTDGAEAVAAEMGGTVDIFGADPGFDPIAQSNQIQDAITSGKYDAFIIYAADGVSVAADVEDAAAAGIAVIAADVVIGPDARTYVPIDGVSSYIGRTGIDHGEFLGEMIVMACEDLDPCKVGYLNGVQALTVDQDRVEALTVVLAAYPNIEIVSNQEAFYLENVGLDVATNMLQANPDINVLATSGDQMMLGAEQAVIDAGLVDQIKLLGNGTGVQAHEAIQEGRFFANYADIPFTTGELRAEFAIRVVRGEEVPQFVKVYDLSPPMPGDSPIITQENVDEFEPQW